MVHSFFVRTHNHRWGHSEESVYQAMERAGLYEHSLLRAQSECLEYMEDYGNKPVEKLIKLALDEADDNHSVTGDTEELDIELIILRDPENWEFAGGDPMSGAPTYNWISETPRPDGYKPNVLVAPLSFVNGKIIPRN